MSQEISVRFCGASRNQAEICVDLREEGLRDLDSGKLRRDSSNRGNSMEWCPNLAHLSQEALTFCSVVRSAVQLVFQRTFRSVV